jgi:phospholipase C
VSVGAGSNGEAQPSAFSDQSTGEGSTSMGVYNVNNGDMPYFKYLPYRLPTVSRPPVLFTS